MGLPGWNSIETTSSLSNVFFWLSIFALLLLGVAEVVSHRYSERHDWLVSRQRQQEKDSSDTEIARLHRDTAAANARAEEARLALEKYKAPRTLSEEQQADLIAELKPFALTANIVVPPPTTPDTGPLATLLQDLLQKSGWKVGFINALGGWVRTVLVCTGKNPPPRTSEAATKLILAFRAAGISAFLMTARGRGSKSLEWENNCRTQR